MLVIDSGRLTDCKLLQFLKAALPMLSTLRGIDIEAKFDDHMDISNYAIENVYFMVNMDIIKGVSDNKFEPKGNAKIEEALAIANRCIEVFKR